MKKEKKELVREALSDDALMDVAGGKENQGYQGEGELLECPQCHGLILCTPDCPMEKHMKNFCDAKN